MTIVLYVLTALCAIGVLLNALAWLNTIFFAIIPDKYRKVKDFTPPVTIIKPARGINPMEESNFRSFFELDYPEYELIFTIHQDAGDSDASLPVIESLIKEYPNVDAKILRTSEHIAVHEKVNNYIEGVSKAKYDIICITDADCYVDKDYLKHDIRPLSDERIGMVTSMQTMNHFSCMPPAFEGLLQNYDNIFFWILFHNFGVLHFVYGHSILFRKKDFYDFKAIECVRDHMLDDMAWGDAFVDNGKKRIWLSKKISHTTYVKASWKGAIGHLTRWAIFDFRYAPSYALVPFVYQNSLIGVVAFVLGMLNITDASFYGQSLSSLAVIFGGATLILRWVGMFISNLIFGANKKDLRYFFLIPFRDMFSIITTVKAVFTNKFSHAGKTYRIRGTKMELID